MPKASVNHSRAGPKDEPTMSLALDVQEGAVPGAPGAWPSGSESGEGGMSAMVARFARICAVRLVQRVGRAAPADRAGGLPAASGLRRRAGRRVVRPGAGRAAMSAATRARWRAGAGFAPFAPRSQRGRALRAEF